MPKNFVGIDVGSTTTKAVLADGDRHTLAQAVVSTGVSAAGAAEEAVQLILGETGFTRADISAIATTGYGRELVPFADLRFTEITSHAYGAFDRIGATLTLIDIGGQDTKAISVGDQGKVRQFVMNDKCAAGTGRFLEVTARALGTDIENLTALAASAEDSVKLNNMCTVFAESEIIGLIAREVEVSVIASGLCLSVAERIGAMAKKIGINGAVYVSGGVAYNRAVVEGLERYLRVPVSVLTEPQSNGAYGAALLAIAKSE